MSVSLKSAAFRLIFCCVFGIGFAVTLRAAETGPNPDAPHVRVAWVQDLGDGKDVFAKGTNLQLMVSDSAVDGGRERLRFPLGPAPSYVPGFRTPSGNVAKPLITPRGDRIVFSDRVANKSYMTTFSGGSDMGVELADGFAAEVWRNPGNGKEYALVMTGAVGVKSLPGYKTATMVQLDNPKHRFVLWHGDLVAADNFQISADGRKAGALFPWPNGGIADLATGTWSKRGKGCWTSFAPDNSYTLMVFDGAHRNMYVHQPARGDRPQQDWKLPIHNAPGIGNKEVYHPRWSNHPHYLAMTGPYGSSQVKEGGTGVEVYVGRMALDLRSVVEWTQISNNARADFFPDVWVAGGEAVTLDAASPVPAVASVEPVNPKANVAQGKLLELSPTPEPNAILPYKHCLIAGHYALPNGTEVAAVHWGIRDSKKIPAALRVVGRSYPLALVPFDQRKDLRSERISNDLENVELELFVDENGAAAPPGP